MIFFYCGIWDKEQKVDNVAKYYGRKLEEYYEEYIYSIAGENSSRMFDDFSTIFPDNNYNPRFEVLNQSIKSLSTNQFLSIIDSDMYLFGLIYVIVFENKTIDINRIDSLKQRLTAKIDVFKNDYSHRKTPSALKYIRARIDESIRIYKNYRI